MALYTFHLFAGAGGGILSDILLGHIPIGAVEINPCCRNVLLQRQRDGRLPPFPIWDDVCTFRLDNPDTRPFILSLMERVRELAICGGFPCQDISPAGKGAGLSGTRSGLWAEFARIIGEVRPRYAFIENAATLPVRGLDRILADLAALGMDAQWCRLGADDVGAWHRRKRTWILAYRNESQSGPAKERSHTRADGREYAQGSRHGRNGILETAHNVSDFKGQGLSARRRQSGSSESARGAPPWADSLPNTDRQHADDERSLPGTICGKRPAPPDLCDGVRQGLALRQGQPGNDDAQQSSTERAGHCCASRQSQPDLGVLVHGLAGGLGGAPWACPTLFTPMVFLRWLLEYRIALNALWHSVTGRFPSAPR